jgi:hypothetical protein
VSHRRIQNRSQHRPVAGLAGPLLWACLLLWAAVATAADRLEIADAAGKPVLIYLLDGERLSVTDGAGTLLIQGERKTPERTDYRLPDGTALARAKGEPERFKLLAPDGGLLRKVKRDGDRIKVSDNEEYANAAQIRRRGEDKWELELGDASLGKIKRCPDQSRLKVKDREEQTRYTLAGAPLTRAPLVLLIPDLPSGEAQALVAEIWLRGW